MQAGRLNKFFHTDEFVCKCGCGLVNIDPDFFKKLTEARRIAEVPFVINSGCRCADHNMAEGGTPTSPHLTAPTKPARGSDIRAETVEIMISILRGAILAGMDGIALGLGFIHLDTKGRKMIKCNAAFTLTARGLFIG